MCIHVIYISLLDKWFLKIYVVPDFALTLVWPTLLSDEEYWTLMDICDRMWQILSGESELEFWV